MKVLVVGGGGREHALAWKCAQSPNVSEVLVAPGNAGTALADGLRNVAVGAEDIDGLLDLAESESVALTIVGPEAPLVAGIVDRFEAAGQACFGPRQAAAQLEGSKEFTKEFLQRHNIPTAAFRCFDEPAGARAYVEEMGVPIVIKADGLAAGKGVVVAATVDEAFAAIDSMLSGEAFGAAGARVVIEEFLEGEEASFIVMTDGKSVLPLATSQDHKARDEGDKGPNTGGMGAYSPAPVITAELEKRVLAEVIQPTLDGLAEEGTPYSGFLYAGLMIAADGTPKVLEYNCRFGDPETQPIMARLKSDLAELCLATIEGRLAEQTASWDSRASLGVVMAAGGYPDSYRKGDAIEGLDDAAGVATVFHAGTALEGEQVVTAGGRVLCVVGLGDDVAAARDAAYAGVDRISWDDEYHRGDIGHRAIRRD